jgi:hypothetical protein
MSPSVRAHPCRLVQRLDKILMMKTSSVPSPTLSPVAGCRYR